MTRVGLHYLGQTVLFFILFYIFVFIFVQGKAKPTFAKIWSAHGGHCG